MEMISRINIELAAWTLGLILLAFLDPHAGLPSFCIFKAAGLEGCPGCGLGRAVSHLLHGEWQESWESHRLAAPALLMLLLRIGKLGRDQYLTLRYE
ncbi:DUF2752 domain-containing protein [Chitinophaga sp. 22620]|uniref:DUF2752 domain-containing protein n=1 Tax=Chitinophaga sp. 22620 TaxID=3453952 RepID=UPI003F82FF34